MTNLITFESIVKKDEHGNPILKGISGSVLEREFITIIGPSGSGKSTILALLNRMIDPDEGSITYKERPYSEIDVLQLRKTIGMVFQNPVMIQGTVRDNLLMGPKIHNERLTEAEIDQLLKSVGLPLNIKDQNARLLSGGQKQRVALARTLANRSEVLLLDEVTASLDPHSTLEIEELINMLNKEHGKTILWVTHNLQQAKRLGQYTWVIANGKLIEHGVTKLIFESPESEITKNFLKTEEAKIETEDDKIEGKEV